MNAPSARVATEHEGPVVTDAQGRKLSLRRLDALDKLRLFKAVGPALAQNEPYLGMALLACSVTAIDNLPCPMPTNEAQIEHLIQRLGDFGLAAVAQGLRPETTTVSLDVAKN